MCRPARTSTFPRSPPRHPHHRRQHSEEAIQANGPTYYYRRDAHTKTSLGCVAANFHVNPAPAQSTNRPLRSAKKESPAWIRFSTGSSFLQPDWKPDAHGMALKVLGVEGRKLLDGEEDELTHDFLMIDNPVFCIRDVPDYTQLTAYQSAGSLQKRLRLLLRWLREDPLPAGACANSA